MPPPLAAITGPDLIELLFTTVTLLASRAFATAGVSPVGLEVWWSAVFEVAATAVWMGREPVIRNITTNTIENMREIEILENMVVPPIVKYKTIMMNIVALHYIIL